MKESPVTIIVSGRNSASTIRQCLESLSAQDWPVDEILVFDNDSSDGSQDIIRDVAAKSSVQITLVDGGPNGFLCTAYNRGAEMAKSEIIVLCHSDGMVPTSGELRKLVAPLVEDASAVAAYPRILMPREVWNRFPFWQKFLFVRAVDASNHAACAIFDAVRRKAFLSIGGFNEIRFKAGNGYGGEDSDFWRRIGNEGLRIYTESCAVHLHSFSPNFGWLAYLKTRKLMARTYGKIIRFQRGLYCFWDIAFFIRPCLALLPFALCVLSQMLFGNWMLGVVCSSVVLCLFAMQNGWKMFTSGDNWLNPRLALVVPCGVFMIYYESFWFFDGIFTKASDEEDGK